MRTARSDKEPKRGVQMALSPDTSAQLEVLRTMEDNEPIPAGRPKPKIVVDRPPKPEDLMAMGLKIRDFVNVSGPRAKPVWRQQIQPMGPSCQGTVKITRPKTPETYINTPTVTPNGSLLWANEEEELAAISQQQAAQSQPPLEHQAGHVRLTNRLTREATVAPIASSSKLPVTSSSKLPTTPLGLQVSVILNAPHKLKRTLRHIVSSDSLPEAKPSKVRRQIPTADEIPVPRYSLRSRTHPTEASTSTPAIPNPSRTLRPRAKAIMSAASAEISCGISRPSAKPLRRNTAAKGSRSRRS